MMGYLRQTTTVNVTKMAPALLAEGLVAAGFSVGLDDGTVLFSKPGEYLYHTYQQGVLHLAGPDTGATARAVKRAYSAQAVRTAAALFGWKLTETAPNQFVAQKRR